MKESIYKKLKSGGILFILSILVFVFWAIAKRTNVYTFKISGTVFEMLWLPMLLLFIITPLLAIYFWITEKLILKSFNLFAVVIFLITLLFLFM
jgi:hypothetical protein